MVEHPESENLWNHTEACGNGQDMRIVSPPRLTDPRDALYGSPESLMASREVLMIPEVSYITRIGDTKLREMRKSGELPAEKVGRLVRYRTAVVRDFLGMSA
jgi:hypothetical protein